MLPPGVTLEVTEVCTVLPLAVTLEVTEISNVGFEGLFDGRKGLFRAGAPIVLKNAVFRKDVPEELLFGKSVPEEGEPIVRKNEPDGFGRLVNGVGVDIVVLVVGGGVFIGTEGIAFTDTGSISTSDIELGLVGLPEIVTLKYVVAHILVTPLPGRTRSNKEHKI